MNPKIKPIHILIHPLYFEKFFEPQRRKLEKKMNTSLSQVRFTEILANKNKKTKLPNLRRKLL